MNSSLTSDVFTEHAKKDDVKDIRKDQGSSKIVENGHDEIPGETTCLLLSKNSGECVILLLTRTL